MYGYMPDKAQETLSYTLAEEPVTGEKLLTITIRAGGSEASFSVLVTLPKGTAPEGGFPYLIEYMPHHYQSWFTKEWVTEVSPNCRMAAGRGYAGINYDCSQVAQDNKTFTGAFYTLYPYKLLEQNSRNGTLLAWAWGVSKIIDAMEQGAGAELGIDPALSLVGGVSRYGKSVAVAGAYDERIKVVIPSCSGAGGIATYRTNNSGKTYDLSSLGGPDAWVNTSANEPLSNLQGGEGYWFCGRFAVIPSVEQIPVDQHMLAALVADPGRHMIIVTGITSEGWNNTEGQCLAYAAAQPAWALLGCPEQNNMIIHLDGHAILQSDMQMILDYCDVHLFGKDPAEVQTDLSRMKGNLFLENNREILYPEFAPYLGK
jgi:endo-1,4-beta-xylanase